MASVPSMTTYVDSRSDSRTRTIHSAGWPGSPSMIGQSDGSSVATSDASTDVIDRIGESGASLAMIGAMSAIVDTSGEDVSPSMLRGGWTPWTRATPSTTN